MVQAWAHYGLYLFLQATYNKAINKAKTILSPIYLYLSANTPSHTQNLKNTLKNKKAKKKRRKKKEKKKKEDFSKLVSSSNQV